MQYFIKTRAGVVSGFSKTHQLVQITPMQLKHQFGKRFDSVRDCNKFIEKYCDIGYGLIKDKCEIIEC